VRIAAEYQRLRHIPECDIVFVEPNTHQGFYKGEDGVSVLLTNCLNPVYAHIQSNNLSDQIDYISTLGMPFRNLDTVAGAIGSFQYALGNLDSRVSAPTYVNYINTRFV
jgi:hypothetical protein